MTGMDDSSGPWPEATEDPTEDLSPEQLRHLYHSMLLSRLIEEKMLVLLRQGRLSKWFSGIGQEAIATGVVSALDPDDFVLPMHRDLGVFTGRDIDLPRLFRQLLGREDGFTKGRDRSFHFGLLQKGIVGMVSHLGAMLPVACGLAQAAQLRGSGRVAAAFTGDGATSEGDFHEALNLAAVWKLPVLFLIENNHYGLSTPTHEQYACRDLAERGAGYGMPGLVVDGNDILAVHQAVSRAADRSRRGEGPTLLEFKTFRTRGHEEASGTDYVPSQLQAEWKAKDPLQRFEALLLGRQILNQADVDETRGAYKARIDALADDALAAPVPQSSVETGVVAPSLLTPRAPDAEQSRQPPERRYVDAISEGLRIAMRRDDRIVLLGQDIAEYGGVFKVTAGFLEEFGKARVRNTPIIESGAVGAAMGLALGGYLPMVEMQFGDFVTCGFNQIVNNLAKTHWRWGERIRVVVRLPIGGGVGAGPFHSQNVESWFTSVPGLRELAQATPYDAKGLLISAFEDGNPVLFLEHKLLYRSARGPVPDGDYALPIGQARVAREGPDATIVTYSIGLTWALAAADALAEEGFDVEVLDLRSLMPWDTEAVLSSVRKTSRCLVLHEASLTGGFGGEIAAVVGREAFEWLDAPVSRLGALDAPAPFAKTLEALHSPKDRLLPALRDLLAY